MSETQAQVLIARFYAGPEWFVRTRQTGRWSWAVDAAQVVPE